MARSPPKQKPRSPTLNQVFGQFVETMKSDPQVGEDTALRIKAIIDSGRTINLKSVWEALFPTEKGTDDAEA
jgi:hypothetical protein